MKKKLYDLFVDEGYLFLPDPDPGDLIRIRICNTDLDVLIYDSQQLLDHTQKQYTIRYRSKYTTFVGFFQV